MSGLFAAYAPRSTIGWNIETFAFATARRGGARPRYRTLFNAKLLIIHSVEDLLGKSWRWRIIFYDVL